MSTLAKSRRPPSSCINCRRRKIRCDKPSPSRACGRCERLRLDCAVTDEIVARPYYHTSKERFELMAAIVHHFAPDTPLTVRDLREYVSTLDCAPGDLGCAQIVQPASPPPSVSQLPDLDIQYSQEETHDQMHDIADGPSASVPEGTVDGEFISDATCQRRFDVASSYTVLQSKMVSGLTDRFPRLATLQQDETLDLLDGEPLYKTPAIALPDRRVCEQSGIQFFKEINSVVYVFSPEMFFNFVEAVYSGKDTSSSVQVIIHLVVALMNNRPEHFELVRMQMECVVEEGSLESIQAMMLMALYRQRRNQRHAAWVALGSATRIAQSLGMHISTTNDSLMVAEQKSRLWWSLYELDQWSSCTLGRSPDQSIDVNTVKPPVENLTASITTPPMYASVSARLTQFLSAAMTRIFLKQQYIKTDVEAMIQDLHAWWASLPDQLTETTMLDSAARATLSLRLRYHYILVLITRPFLLEFAMERSLTGHNVSICEANNDDVINILLDMQARNILARSFWFDSHYIVSACIILLLRMMRNPSSADLRAKANSMQVLLKLFPGKIEDYASRCFEQFFEDIDARDQNDHVTELRFNAVMTNLELWEDFGLSKLDDMVF